MVEEQFKAFLEKVQSDTNLQEKLKAAADANAVVDIAKEAGFSISANAVVDFAKEAGFSISADDLKNAQSDISELSDEELEGVAGGIIVLTSVAAGAAFVGIIGMMEAQKRS